MSEPLEDLRRLKVTKETTRWLRWKAAVTGKSFPEIARETLHAFAMDEMERCQHESNLLNSIIRGEGHERGTSGNPVKPYPKAIGDD